MWRLVLNPSILLLDISTGDLKAPQAGRRRIPEPSRNGASAYTFTTPLLTAHAHIAVRIDKMTAHHNHTRPCGQIQRMAIAHGYNAGIASVP